MTPAPLKRQLNLVGAAKAARRPFHITKHPLWPELAPYFRVELCAHDGHKNARFRIELASGMPAELRARALDVRIRCCACGREIQPIRARVAPGNKRSEVVGKNLYFACACPLSVEVGCSRGTLAREEYRAVKTAVESLAVQS